MKHSTLYTGTQTVTKGLSRAINSIYLNVQQLHRVHKRLLDAVEDDDAAEQKDNHEGETVGQPAPADERTGIEEAELEGLDDRSHRVQAHQESQVKASYGLALNLAQWVNYRSRVHPKLNDEREQNLKVTVFCRHRGDDDSEAERQTGNHHDEQRKQKDVPVGSHRDSTQRISDVDNDEQSELDSETYEVADSAGQRTDQTREINLAEDGRIGDERVGSLCETVREVLPEADAAKIEQRLRNAIGRDSGDSAEDHHVHDDRKRRLDHEPERSEDCLLVLSDDVSLDK